MLSNIYLIGPRACGKTSVGRILADKLNFKFYDTDEVLVRKAGCEIAQYVEQKGWNGFRDLEAEVLGELSKKDRAVISCGGGIVVRQENRNVLKKNFTVYLKTDVRVLANRLEADPNVDQRPSLTGKSIVDEIRDVLEERKEFYHGCAGFVVDGSDSIDDVSGKIMKRNQSSSMGDK